MDVKSIEEFDKTVQKTNELLKEIGGEFGWETKVNQSYSALRAVLHTLRDALTIDEAVQFGAQMPMLVKGIYYDGWNPSKVPRRMDKEEFLQEIRQQFQFSVEGDIRNVVRAVLLALNKHISPGEMEDVISILPKDVSQMMRRFLGKDEVGETF